MGEPIFTGSANALSLTWTNSPETVDVRHDQVVAAVAGHVPRDVNMGDFASARRVEIGRHRYQRVFGRRFGIEPVQTARLVGDQPVTSADVGHIDEYHVATDRCVEVLHPGAIVECIDAHATVVVLADIHDGKVGDGAIEKESRQECLPFCGADDDLVPLEDVVSDLREDRCAGDRLRHRKCDAPQ